MARPRIVSVVGTRPNFMKIAPVARELGRRDFEHVLVHTGQHYDAAMSDVFFEELGIGAPDHMLSVGSGSHAAQTARVLERLEPLLKELQPDLVLVPGDVNSTLAAAITAAKLGVRVGHIEAGLRSFDRSMPEELNRIVTDQLSDVLFTHSPEANAHLRAEGRPDRAIHYVGNTMIDTLVALRERIEATGTAATQGLAQGQFLLVTLHRPALVDGPLLPAVLRELQQLAREIPVIFPAHPRTRKAMEGLPGGVTGISTIEPLGYLAFMGLVAASGGVLTDSGGIQEETTFLGVPCFTLRDNTERPITCELGTNVLLGLDPERIAQIPELLAGRNGAVPRVPPLWDGLASRRIVDVLERAGDEGGPQMLSDIAAVQ